jgi:pimeloyl-ACP methyl ester carboxylesterase
MEEIRRSRGSADYRAASGVMRDILVKVVNESYEEELSRLRSRVLLLWGTADDEVPVAVAERSLRLIREAGGSAELEVLPGVGHFVPTQAPNAIARVLGEVMAR